MNTSLVETDNDSQKLTMKLKSSTQMKRLSELSEGQVGVLIGVQVGMHSPAMRLLEMGMVEGASVKLRRRGPFGSPLQISVCGTELCLRSKEAAFFWVQTTR